MRIACSLIPTLVSLVLVVGCATGTRREQAATQPARPYWSLSAAEKQKLLVGASALKAGDTYDHVISALGQPTSDKVLTRIKSNVAHGRILRYQALIWEKNSTNLIQDQFVVVVLDTRNLVCEVGVQLTMTH